MTIDQHLEHLLKMLAPPFTANFKAWAWHRAKEIALDPELAELPSMLEAAMLTRSRKSTPEPPCTAPLASTSGGLTSITSSVSK